MGCASVGGTARSCDTVLPQGGRTAVVEECVFMQVVLKVDMMCGGCEAAVKRVLNKMEGAFR